MDDFSRYFTPQQANLLLPRLRPRIEELLRIRQTIIDLSPDLAQSLEKALNNGGSQATGAVLDAMELARRLMEEIQESGALIKDISRGLLDFPSHRDGRVVFLCWQYDEPAVEFWHELDAGFPGRQPL
jgi:hypothetical protein